MPKVLLVADASWVRNQVAAALNDQGTEVREVTDPRAVVDEVVDFEPDVIIIDMQIGSMGGMAVARAVRNAEYESSLADIPLILLLDRAADAFLAKRASAHAWLTKPITAQDLRATLDRVQGAGAVR
jgi:CheY-like chemotaxis protein